MNFVSFSRPCHKWRGKKRRGMNALWRNAELAHWQVVSLVSTPSVDLRPTFATLTRLDE